MFVDFFYTSALEEDTERCFVLQEIEIVEEYIKNIISWCEEMKTEANDVRDGLVICFIIVISIFCHRIMIKSYHRKFSLSWYGFLFTQIWYYASYVVLYRLRLEQNDRHFAGGVPNWILNEKGCSNTLPRFR